MKIAILHSGDLQKISLGGVDRYIKNIIRFCKDDEITVFGTGTFGEDIVGEKCKKEYNGKSYYFVPISTDKRRPLSVYYMAAMLRWLNMMEKYDCIYAQRTEYTIPFIFSKERKKVIQMIHGSSKYSEIGFGSRLGKIHLVLEKIAISIAAKTFIILNREEFGVPYYKWKYKKFANRIFYGRNPIDTTVYQQRDKQDCRKKVNIALGDKIILYSGRIEDNPKRVFLLPHICMLLNSRGIKSHFLILGEGNDLSKLQQKVVNMNLKNQFSFIGYVDDVNRIAIYNCAADVSINISMFEGTCTSILESIACGTPVVATDVGDIHECIFDNENGIIIKNGDNKTIVKDSADALYSILQKPPSMNTVYLNYSGNEVVQNLKETIKGLI